MAFTLPDEKYSGFTVKFMATVVIKLVFTEYKLCRKLQDGHFLYFLHMLYRLANAL
jgi:hypothetical protein